MDLLALLAALAAEQLPATASELADLHKSTLAHINLLQARAKAGEKLSNEDVGHLRSLLNGRDRVVAAQAEAATKEAADAAELQDLLTRAEGDTASGGGEPAGDEPEPGDVEQAVGDVVDAADAITKDAAAPVTAGAPSADGGNRPISFSGLHKSDPPAPHDGKPAWKMRPGAPGYIEGPVGFRELGRAIDSVSKGTRKAKSASAETRGAYFAQVIADLQRPNVPLISDSHELVAEIERVTRTIATSKGSSERVPLTTKSLVAAGGWCAPSEQLYDFCDVPSAVDLLSLPEITINRGGVRWPVEPDVTALIESFQFFFTEPQLQAETTPGIPDAVKECVEIPCPDTFEEMRLNVVGYCVEAGILQTQGWPELITWFMQTLAAEHLRAISRRSILDMVADSQTKTFSSTYTIGTVGAVLNSLALMATNIRLARGLGRNVPIEGVAPSWLAEILRADLAYYDDVDAKSVTDGQVAQWFADRNIVLQYVGDWQTRDTDLPGNLDTVRWPGHVDVMLYPAGTWFRAMQPVIEIGVMYPKEQLVVNRYTRMFTEDALALGRRCHPSIVARIPLAVNGGIGNRYTIAYSDTTGDSGQAFNPAPEHGGQAGLPKTNTITASGTITAGTFKLTFDGDETGSLAYTATAAQIKTALAALPDYTAADFTVTGGALPGTPVVITHPVGSLTVTSASLTGGSLVVS